MATTYRIETLTGRGLPRNVDAKGYDTRAAAEAMADDCHDGKYRVVSTSDMEREGQARAMASAILQHGAEYRPGETREMAWEESDGTRYRGSVEIDADLVATAARLASVTDEQIGALRTEAGQAGDVAQVALCEQALSGDAKARAKCERAILDARAQRER